jgi:hypothetical protein
VKITKRVVDSAKPAARDVVFWDSELTGFGLRVKLSGVKSYGVQYRARGLSRRVTISQHGPMTPEEARKEAKVLLGRVARGGDPAVRIMHLG